MTQLTIILSIIWICVMGIYHLIATKKTELNSKWFWILTVVNSLLCVAGVRMIIIMT